MSILGLIILSTAVFTGTILILVVILNYATSKLVSTGDVKILINGDDDKSLSTPAGSTLLQTLAAEKILDDRWIGGAEYGPDDDLILLSGYQAVGTRGRALQEGAESLRRAEHEPLLIGSGVRRLPID